MPKKKSKKWSKNLNKNHFSHFLCKLQFSYFLSVKSSSISLSICKLTNIDLRQRTNPKRFLSLISKNVLKAERNFIFTINNTVLRAIRFKII